MKEKDINFTDMDAIVKEFLYTKKVPLFRFIVIETSEKCNRSCDFCPNSIYKQSNGLMSIELFHKIILELTEINYSSMLCLHLYNEPLLDRRLLSLISFAREHLPNATIMFSTNGDKLTLNLWKDLRRNGLDFAIIGQYDGEMNPNIKEIKAAMPDIEQPAFKVRVSTDLTNTRGGLVNRNIIPAEPLSECCARVFFQLMIRFSGLAVLCCEDYLNEIVLGDANTHNVVDIWTGKKANEVRDYLARKNRHFAKACTHCNISYANSIKVYHFVQKARRIPFNWSD